MKINWKQKLSSRKFLATVVGFVTALMIVLNVDNLTMERVIALVSAIVTLIAYIFGESIVDASRINNQVSEPNEIQVLGFVNSKKSDKNED